MTPPYVYTKDQIAHEMILVLWRSYNSNNDWRFSRDEFKDWYRTVQQIDTVDLLDAYEYVKKQVEDYPFVSLHTQADLKTVKRWAEYFHSIGAKYSTGKHVSGNGGEYPSEVMSKRIAESPESVCKALAGRAPDRFI